MLDNGARLTPLKNRYLPMISIKRRPSQFQKGDRKQGDSTFCGLKKQCGLCHYVNEPYEASLRRKHALSLSAFKAHGLLDKAQVLDPTPSPKSFFYRTSAKLAVGPGFALGLYQEGSHRILEIPDCPLHSETLAPFIRDLKSSLLKTKLTPYQEKSNTGDLRYVTMRANHLTGEMMLVFVVTGQSDTKDHIASLVRDLKAQGHPIYSAYQNINGEKGNFIYGKEFQKITINENLRESLVDLSFIIPPGGFFQVNPWMAEVIYRRIEQHAGHPIGARIAWDLYCGLGPISMVLARSGYRVWGVEENPQAIAMAKAGLEKNQLDEHRLTFESGLVEDRLAAPEFWAQTPDLIVANPSRRGLAPAVREALKDLAQKKSFSFFYLSCAKESMIRDLKDLTEGSSPLKLRQLEAFDMFPNTDKLEWLAVLN